MRPFSIILFAACLPGVALADDEAPESSAVVRAQAPTSFELRLGHAELERTGGVTLAEALRSAPGVDLLGAGVPGSVGRVSLRGAAPEQSVLLLDGLRLSGRVSGATVGGSDPGLVPVGMLQRVVVVFGPASALYGPNAVAGALLLQSREPAEPRALNVTVQGAAYVSSVTATSDEDDGDGDDEGGSRLLYQGRISVNGATREGRRFSSAAVTVDRSAGWLPGTASHLYDLALSTGSLGAAGGQWALVHAFDSATGAPPWNSALDDGTFDADDRVARRGAQVIGVLRRALGAGYHFEAGVSALMQSNTLYNPVGDDRDLGLEAPVAEQRASEVQARAALRRERGAHVASVHVELGRESLDADQVGAGRAVRGAIGAQWRTAWRSLGVDLAARVDGDTAYGWQVSPRAATELRLGRWARVAMSLGRGFRPPSFSERSWPMVRYGRTVAGAIGERGNADLRVEGSWGLDAVVVAGHPGGRWSTTLRGFGLRTDDTLRWALDDEGFRRPLNVGRSDTLGVSLDATVRLGRWWRLLASGLTQGVWDASGAAIEGRLRHKLTARAEFYQRAGWRLWAEAVVVERTGRDAAGDPWRGVFVNARVGRQFGPVGVFARVENALDQRFESVRGLPTAGRTVWLGLGYDLDED